MRSGVSDFTSERAFPSQSNCDAGGKSSQTPGFDRLASLLQIDAKHPCNLRSIANCQNFVISAIDLVTVSSQGAKCNS
jgi:hypothetical protein